MKLKMYAVKDKATEMYGNPMFLVATGQAIRSFTDEINNKEDRQNQLAKHPEHFELYELGEYDTDDGSFKTISPNCLIRGIDCVIKT
jgi:hypothetical protein